jgi:hypothetical protein
MTKEEDAFNIVEKELKSLKEELEVHKEAKRVSASCQDIVEHSEREDEPFSSSYHQTNTWHKSEGGWCTIL